MVKLTSCFPFPSGFFSETMEIHSVGQMASQRWQAMHSSSRVSGSRRRRGTPLKRGANSSVSRGYSTVTWGRNWFRRVTAIPCHSSRRRNFVRISLSFFIRRLPGPLSLGQDHHEARGDDVEDRQRDHPVPAQLHELIVSVPGERSPQPEVDEKDQESLDAKPEQ